MKRSTTGTLMVVGAAAGFGTIGIFGELAASVGLELPTLLPFRFAIATVLVAVAAAVRGWSVSFSRRTALATAALGVVYTGMTLFFFVSLRYLTAGLATIVLYTYPALVVLLSGAVLDEAVTLRKVLALGLAMSGVVLVVGTDTAGADPLGVGLALGAAGCYAVYTAGSRTLSASVTPRTLLLGVLVGTTGSMVFYAVATGRFAVPSGGQEWGIVLGLTLVGTVVPQVLFYEGVTRLEASRVGVVSTAEPLVTVVLGALLLDEPVTPPVVAGGVLVLSGVVLVQRVRGSGAGRSAAPTTDDRGG